MGAAYCWGNNDKGQLGDGTITQHTAPVAVSMPTGVTFVSLMSGGAHTCALTSAGMAYCWGDNNYGQLGDGTTVQRNTPVAISMPTGVTFASLSAGWDNTCALTVAGVAYCWGDNNYGVLGNGTFTDSRTPVRVSMPANVIVASLSVGEHHACARSSVGAAYCWGGNLNGQLGNGTTSAIMNLPVVVNRPTGVTFTSLSTGKDHTCARTSTGAAYCWGYNWAGQLGDGTTTQRTQPMAVKRPTGVTFASISAGGAHTCALTSAGVAYCWGDNEDGQLGDNTTTQRNTPVVVSRPASVTFASLSAGGLHTCARTSAGAAYCWGYNYFGQLGDGTTTSRTTPVIVP